MLELNFKKEKEMKKIITAVLYAALLASATVSAHTINGHYASLVSCDYGYSAVRGESGYTGTYRVLGELFTQYFGSRYCPA
jgi:hypothetical protein